MLADALATNASLLELDIEGNRLDMQVALVVGKALLKNDIIVTLKVGWLLIYCCWQMQKYYCLKQQLENDVCVLDLANTRVIQMGRNPLTVTGATAVLTALRDAENSILASLDLSDVTVDLDFMRLVGEVTSKRQVTVIHGPILKAGSRPSKGRDALDIFRDFVNLADTKIIEVLASRDTDHSKSVTQDDFATSMAVCLFVQF